MENTKTRKRKHDEIVDKSDEQLLCQFFDKISLQLKENDQYGKTLLHHAVSTNNFRIVKILIDKKFVRNIIPRDNDERTPLHYAVSNGNLDIVELLANKFGGIKYVDKNRKAALHEAVYLCKSEKGKKNSLNIVKILIKYGANVNVKDNSGWTPLHIAAWYSDLDIVKYLVEKGADVNAKDNLGQTPLHISTNKGDLENVKALIHGGAIPEYKNHDGKTSIHLAASNGNLHILFFFNDTCADMNIGSKDGKTPLHYAASNKDIDTIKGLLLCGAYINAKDKYGITVLHIATKNNDLELLKFLVKNTDKIDTKDKHGMTPLHKAVEYGYIDIVKFLVMHCDVNVDARNVLQETPLHVSIKNRNYEISKFLLDLGPKYLTKDKYGNTLLDIIIKNSDIDMLKLIHKYTTLINRECSKYKEIPQYTVLQTTPPDRFMFYNITNGIHTGTVMHLTVKMYLKNILDYQFNTGLIVGLDNVYDYDELVKHNCVQSLDIIEFLVSKGIDMHIKNDNGWTPLDLLFRAPHCNYTIKRVFCLGMDLVKLTDESVIGLTPSIGKLILQMKEWTSEALYLYKTIKWMKKLLPYAKDTFTTEIIPPLTNHLSGQEIGDLVNIIFEESDFKPKTKRELLSKIRSVKRY